MTTDTTFIFEASEEFAVRDSLSIYMQEAKALSLLITKEEEEELYEPARCGDTRAINLLCSNNLLLVVSVAKGYRNRGMPFSDLISAGNLGLLNAIRLFDPARGNALSTFATFHIRSYINTEILNKGREIRVPAGRLKEASRAKRAGDSTLVEALPQMIAPPTETDDSFAPEYFIEPEADPSGLLEAYESVDLLTQALTGLSEEEQYVMRFRYGLDDSPELSLAEIAKGMGVVAETVRTIQQRALSKLYRMFESEGFTKADLL